MGTLTKETGKPTLRLDTTFKSIADIKNINIPYHEGTKKLAEIATITEETNEQSQVAWRNGDTDFILLQIGRTKDYTQLDMSEAVRTEISKIKQEGLLENMQVGEIVSQADYVRNAIDGVVDNILIGGVIAIIVLLLFLRNIRATMIIGLSIPASILLTMLMMNLFGYSLNLASLIGLGLGIGMLVDASIVVLESIYKKKRQGIPNKTAVISGTKEVFTAVISSMLTTIVVFLPIGILDDDVGKLYLY
ncbi:efflux RND transporter permease subunit [Paracerasibacillus soli]|uniref:Efflux RND transporter permease subunit n=1 Tax=Paracerasibacillus soli TaxID=480284 RepID=A0ABU5CTF8_9BACI|nr:efflux RND transporter permease subunit [Virgibacillus soli]MDY0409648.1 efflux RND transporter permease subunit [Virgibacillus soli]